MDSQPPHGGPRPFGTPVPGVRCLLLTSRATRPTSYLCTGAEHSTHKININVVSNNTVLPVMFTVKLPSVLELVHSV